MSTRTVLSVVACMLLAHGRASAPAAVPLPASPQESPSFPVTTRLVQISVIVQDKDGQPVRGLTRDDFRLLENGKEQPIDLFVEEVAAAAPRLASPGAAPGEPSVTFSNLGEGPAVGVCVILVDRLNTRWDDQLQARDQVVKLLRQAGSEDPIALYLLDAGGNVRVLHDFTSDTASLLRALERHRARVPTEVVAADEEPIQTGKDPELDAWLRETHDKENEDLARDRALYTTRALEAIARHLAGVRGRKNLVWISSGFPLTIGEGSIRLRSVTDEIRLATRALGEANVAVYPIDAGGLATSFLSAPVARAGPPSGPTTRTPFTPLGMRMPARDAMQLLAEETGGRAFYNTNDIAGAVRRSIEDTRVSYLLGYSPSHGRWDGKFREVKVEVRRSGVEVRHRRGYLALAQPAGRDDGTSREQALRLTLRSPLPETGLGLTVQLQAAGPEAPAETAVVLRIDPRGITLQKSGDRFLGTVDVLIGQGLPESFIVDAYLTLNLKLTARQHEQVMREGIVVGRSITLRAGAHRISVAARDLPSGATGSVFIPADRARAPTGRE